MKEDEDRFRIIWKMASKLKELDDERQAATRSSQTGQNFFTGE
jgi:hypothetical protein